MHPFKHIAIYISADEKIGKLVGDIMAGNNFLFANGLEEKRGALFSAIAIRQLVKEEVLHDHFVVATCNHHSLNTSSSGEQRRALLQHILTANPEYIIVDNVFESLDAAGQQTIVAALNQVSAHTLIIQLLYRKNDCLPFIDTVCIVHHGTVIKVQSREVFMQSAGKHIHFSGATPPPLKAPAVLENTLVKIENISIQFNERPILQNIYWEIKQGEFWQLTGPNGSGKTTLLSMITGDSAKGYGQQLYLFGKKKGTGETVWDVKQHIGYFTSSIAGEFPRMDSVERMLLSGFVDSIGLYTLPSGQQIKLAGQWLVLLGLYDIRRQPFRFLSLAQQRMVLIARAMVKHPPLLILDEPTAGLDDDNALLFTSLINKISAETSMAIIYVSHRQEAGLLPGKIFELVPNKLGSIGIVR